MSASHNSIKNIRQGQEKALPAPSAGTMRNKVRAPKIVLSAFDFGSLCSARSSSTSILAPTLSGSQTRSGKQTPQDLAQFGGVSVPSGFLSFQKRQATRVFKCDLLPKSETGHRVEIISSLKNSFPMSLPLSEEERFLGDNIQSIKHFKLLYVHLRHGFRVQENKTFASKQNSETRFALGNPHNNKATSMSYASFTKGAAVAATFPINLPPQLAKPSVSRKQSIFSQIRRHGNKKLKMLPLPKPPQNELAYSHLNAFPLHFNIMDISVRHHHSKTQNSYTFVENLSRFLIAFIKKNKGSKNKFQQLKNISYKVLQSIMFGRTYKKNPLLGLAFRFSGRVYGAKKAMSFKMLFGSVPFSTLNKNIDYAKIMQKTRNGT